MDRDAGGLTRREAAYHGFGGLAVLCSFDKVGTLTMAPSGKPGPARRSEIANLFEPFQAELTVPPVLPPTERTQTFERYELAMRRRNVEILPGMQTPIMGYDGRFPGPTIRARVGRRSEIRQINELDQPKTVHLHGGEIEEESDGALHEYYIPAGGSRTYFYDNEQPQATLWFHDHIHGSTGPNMNAGLNAFYLLDGPLDEELNLPRGRYDVPLMIQDRAFNDDGSFVYAQNLGAGFMGDTILVNGRVVPRMQVERRLYRFRLLNASNARVYRIVLGNNRPMQQIAGDGGLLPRPRVRRAIELSSGERAEILFDFRRFRPGSQLVLRNALGGASTSAVMRFDVVGGGGREQFQIPDRMRPMEQMPAPVTTRTFKLSQDPLTQEWQINDQGFSENRIDASVQLGTTEIWEFNNPSEHPHPMHLHGCHFRVIDVNGEQPHPGDRGWKDTVNVKPGATVRVRPWFKAHAGMFVFHCHSVEHTDFNMMGTLEMKA